MLQTGYTQENALIVFATPAVTMSATGPKKRIPSLETVSYPVLPRQHRQPSSAITGKDYLSIAVLTKTMHFSSFATPQKPKDPLIKHDFRQSLKGHLNHTTPDYFAFSLCQPNSFRRLLSPPAIIFLIPLASSPEHGERTGSGGI